MGYPAVIMILKKQQRKPFTCPFGKYFLIHIGEISGHFTPATPRKSEVTCCELRLIEWGAA